MIGVRQQRDPGVATTAGALAARTWLNVNGLIPSPGSAWDVMVSFDVVPRPALPTFDDSVDTRFQIEIDARSWSYYFCHAGRSSSVCVTDVPRVRDFDNHDLVELTPPLREIGMLLRTVEKRYRVSFLRRHAAIRSNILGAEPVIREWATTF